MEVASSREHPTICRRFVEASNFFDHIRKNGEWQYHELH